MTQNYPAQAIKPKNTENLETAKPATAKPATTDTKQTGSKLAQFGVKKNWRSPFLTFGRWSIHRIWVTNDHLFWLSGPTTKYVPLDAVISVSSHRDGSQQFHFTDGSLRVSISPDAWTQFVATLIEHTTLTHIKSAPSRLSFTRREGSNPYRYFETVQTLKPCD